MLALPDGNLMSAGEDQVIKMWNPNDGSLIKTFYGHDDFIRRLDLDKDGFPIYIITCRHTYVFGNLKVI